MLTTLKQWWEEVKSFFKHSVTIAYARLLTILGILIAVAGSIDWSAIGSLNWTTPKQTMWIGIGMLVNGIFTEIARRRTL